MQYLLSNGTRSAEDIVMIEKEHAQLRQRFPRRGQRIAVDFNLATLRASAHRKPRGFVEFIMRRGRVVGDRVYLDEEANRELQITFLSNREQAVIEPTWSELASNFAGAMAAWARAGYQVVDEAEYQRRHTVCQQCEHWRPAARLGLGKCEKCKCTRLKLWLSNSRCPDQPPRW